MAVVGGVGLAGCEGRTASGPETEQTPTHTTGQPSPKTTIDTTAQSSPTRTPFEPPPCPNKPTDLTEERAARFVLAFERAYRSRVIYDPDLIAWELYLPDPEEVTPTTTGDGYIFHFRVWEGSKTRRDVTGDWYYSVRYFISTDSVYRLKQVDKFDEPLPDPREDGTAVSCPPQGSD